MLSFTHRDDVGGDGKDNGREINFTNIKVNIFVVTCLNDVSRVPLQPTAMVKLL